jgi:hypothetical protein
MDDFVFGRYERYGAGDLAVLDELFHAAGDFRQAGFVEPRRLRD